MVGGWRGANRVNKGGAARFIGPPTQGETPAGDRRQEWRETGRNKENKHSRLLAVKRAGQTNNTPSIGDQEYTGNTEEQGAEEQKGHTLLDMLFVWEVSWCYGVLGVMSWVHDIMVLWLSGNRVSWCYRFMMQRFHIMAWFYGVTVLLCHGIMVFWCPCVMVSWFHCSMVSCIMVSWCYDGIMLCCHGIIASWCYGVMVSLYDYSNIVLWCQDLMLL